MPRFRVTAHETKEYTMIVEADSKSEAREEADKYECFSNKWQDVPEFYYSEIIAVEELEDQWDTEEDGGVEEG